MAEKGAGQPGTLAAFRRYGLVVFVWMVVWGGMNTGPWYLRHPQSLLDIMHGLRCLLPFVAGFLGLLLIATRHGDRAFHAFGPVRFLLLFGVVCVASSTVSERPLSAFYWAGVYFSAVLVVPALLAGPDRMDRGLFFLKLSWLIVGVQAVGLFLAARGVILSGAMHETAYEVNDAIPEVGGMAMSRSSGVSRFFSVAAIVVLSLLYRERKTVLKPVWAAVFLLCLFVMYKMQSRGALFGLAISLAFYFSIAGVRRGVFLRAGIFLAMVAVGFGLLSPESRKRVTTYLRRGQSEEQFRSMTGRTETYRRGWELFKTSPFVGLGGQADRIFLGGEHMHNAYLHALIQSGVAGTVPFVLAWLTGWGLLIRALRRRAQLPPAHQWALVEAGAVFVFLTVRSFPECTGSFFGVDLLILLPVVAYFQILNEHYFALGQRARAAKLLYLRPVRADGIAMPQPSARGTALPLYPNRK